MRFLADECTDTQLVEQLRVDGHDVLYVMETMRGESDDAILDRAYQEQRILLTEDKDFGELVFRLRKPAICVVLLRFAPGEEARKLLRLRELLAESAETFANTFIVVEPNNMRIRPLF